MKTIGKLNGQEIKLKQYYWNNTIPSVNMSLVSNEDNSKKSSISPNFLMQ